MSIDKNKLDREALILYLNAWTSDIYDDKLCRVMADAAIDAYGGTPEEIATRIESAELGLSLLIFDAQDAKERQAAARDAIREVMGEGSTAQDALRRSPGG